MHCKKQHLRTLCAFARLAPSQGMFSRDDSRIMLGLLRRERAGIRPLPPRIAAFSLPQAPELTRKAASACKRCNQSPVGCALICVGLAQ
jgi:hypothetical protein